jgi:hypothetical protein
VRVARWLLKAPNVIRITIDSSKGSRLVVEGHLSGSAVDVLRKSCATRGMGTVLDLSGLIFADRFGAGLLNELIADGFVIEGCSGFIGQLLLSNAGARVT